MSAIATLRCACARLLDPREGGKCAFCRMLERGDNRLICHDGELGDACECGCQDESPPTVVGIGRTDTSYELGCSVCAGPAESKIAGAWYCTGHAEAAA